MRTQTLRREKESLTDTALLMTITVCTFCFLYVLAMAVWGGGFLNPQQFFDIFNNNAYLIVISCGLTVVMIGSGIDISVGGMIAFVTMTCVIFIEDHGGSPAGALTIALGMGLAAGLIQGFLISYLQIQPFIVTLGGMFFAKGMTTIVSSVPRTITDESFLALKNARVVLSAIGSYGKAGNFIPVRIELGVLIALAVVFFSWALCRWTRFGRNLYAVGGNRHSALMLGINVKRTVFLSYVLCGLFAGIAGYLYVMHTGAGNASNATAAEIQAIASSIIGGTLLTGGVGNVIGSLFGVLSLKTINSIVIASGLREPYWQSITTGLMLCFFILLQSIILEHRKKKTG